jgi:predicted ribosome quality control (RQC) complex YloA/Tae2 family protein
MFFDALTMACIVDELRDRVLGGRVQQIVLPDHLTVGLEIYAQHQRWYLLASAHAEMGRLLMSSEKLRRGVDKEMGLLVLMRKHTRGAILSAIEQPPFERVARLEFDHPDWGSSELVVEIMGRHSNIILVDASQKVLDAVKRVGPQLSPSRPILPGQPYAPPPAQAKLTPTELTEYRLRQILDASEPESQVWQALVAGLRGMSPLLAREITYRALGQPRATVATVERLSPLLAAIRELLSSLENGQWQPTLALEGGRAVAYAPYRVTHRGAPQAMPTMSQAIEAYTTAMASADAYAAAKRPVQEAINAARARLQRRREALQRALDQAGEADQWRQWGEWLLVYAHTVVPGQTDLLADTGEGEPLYIPLDPLRSAADNAQTYFARYRKAQRAAEGGPARVQEVDLALRDLEQLETDLQLAASRPEIDEVRTALVTEGYVRANLRKQTGKARSQVLSLTSPDGLTILVGRNSRQNDEVTFHLAKGNDWWFHARGAPGAHVIIRTEGQEVSPSTIRQAASLAAHFSRLRDEPMVAVDYTQRRHVRRIPGAAPGLVTYTQEETIRVPPRGPDLSAA